MALQKFRSIDEMPPLAPRPQGPERIRRLRSFWAGWARLVPPLDLRGVRRYRTLEEADADRETAEQDRARQLRSERQGRGCR